MSPLNITIIALGQQSGYVYDVRRRARARRIRRQNELSH
jgi:hypothetical protein